MNTLQAQTSKVNVTIDGPGVVDEYLTVGTDGTKQLKLKAVPSKFLGDVTFDGWSGDATGMSEELIVSPDKAQNIHATFTYHRPTKKYPLLNLKQSWADMGKPMYYEMPTIPETQDRTITRSMNYLPVDYNRDGYIDYVQFPKKGAMGIDNHRENVRFWLGQPDGSFIEDPKNDNRMLGTVYSCEVKYADLNDDGLPDFCSFSSGYDREGMTGDYPVVLMSGPDGVYTDLRYTDYDHGYFHGGTVGDIDNDGDIDVLFWDMWHGDGTHSLLLINDGVGNLTMFEAKEYIDLEPLLTKIDGDPLYQDMEIFDLNNDGYNDLIMCSNDHLDKVRGYINPPIVLWGSSSGKFSANNLSQLPPPRLGFGISSNFVFYDFNGDGRKEIIVQKCGDGDYNNSKAFVSCYFQVCEWKDDQYVDKTEDYIPVENIVFNTGMSELRNWIENIDGTDYLLGTADGGVPGIGCNSSGGLKIYAIRNGIMEPVSYELETKIPSYNEGIPLYADDAKPVDFVGWDDGVNPVDTMYEHRWIDTDFDVTHGNMWRINMYHRKDVHFGRTCIRWNRDGLDPKKKQEDQMIDFSFLSLIDVQNLLNNDYYLELYIKNTDPDLSLKINGTTIDVRNTDEGKFTGEWQRMTCPLRDIGLHVDKIDGFGIVVDKGDHNNEFYLDDIRIRRLSISEPRDDYERAFRKDYVDGIYYNKERTSQITSQEFKALLKPLIEKFAPTKMDYFNSRISDYDLPLTRNIAVGIAYYTAICIGADTNNYMNESEQPEDFWAGCWDPEVSQVLPHANDEPTAPVSPDDNFWMEWQEIMQAVMWNSCHVSDFSNIEVIPRDKEANSYHWDNPLTWEEAICAITRLYDSLDPELIKTMPEAITISDAKQVPYCSDKNLDFTDLPDLKAYVATGYDKAKGTIWLTRVKEVPAETGFLLIGDPGDYDIPTVDGVSDVYYKNMFKGTLEGTTIYTTDGDFTNYYLSSGASGVGFYKVTNESGVSIKANRCYLPILTDIPAGGSEGDAEVIKVSAAKQVPYYTSKNIDFSSLDDQGVKAYTATGYNYTSGVIWLTRVKKVPAQTGILVMADKEGEYSVPTTSVQSIYENMFTGSETAQTIYTTETDGDITYINYYLSNGASGVGFYKVTNPDGQKMGANRSYLQIPKRSTAAGARGMSDDASFSKMILSDNDDVIGIPLFAGDATGISDVQQRVGEKEVWHNLQGQRVEKPGKGVYIINGRKVVIK